MDKDAEMLKKMGNALVELQVKFRSSSLGDRVAMRPVLEKFMEDYAKFQISLLEEGVITTDEDLQEMAKIREEIDRAADKQDLLKAIVKAAAFVVSKV